MGRDYMEALGATNRFGARFHEENCAAAVISGSFQRHNYLMGNITPIYSCGAGAVLSS